MRRRVVRDLGTIVGVVVILAAVVGININMRLDTLTEKFEKMRRAYEANAAERGTELLDWEVLRETKGSLGGTVRYDDRLREADGRTVNLMGFMTPIDQFRAATHFMLLPLPIECYFCKAPPLRDVMLVRLAEGEAADLVEEPVMITGQLVLTEGEDSKFYYSLERASRTTEGETTRKTYSQQHRREGQTMGKELLAPPDHVGQIPEQKQEELLPPSEVPTAESSASVSPPAS